MSNSKKLNGKGGKVNTPTTPSTPASSSSSAPTPTVASPSTATFVPSLPDPSELVQGASLHITTSRGTAFDGTLFAYDAAAQLLIVEISYPFDDPRSYHDRPDSTSTKLELAAEAAVKGEGKKDFTILNAKQIRSGKRATKTTRKGNNGFSIHICLVDTDDEVLACCLGVRSNFLLLQC